VPNFATFSKEYDSRLAVTTRERTLDRRILSPLDRAAYVATATALRDQMTDSVIEDAVMQMPRSYYEKTGEKLVHELKVRRDHLPEAAERYYRIVMSQADVYGSDGDDTVTAVRERRRHTEVDAGSRFQGRFDPKQTDEVRLYLFEGEDRVLVSGAGDKGPRLVIAGGPGDVVGRLNRNRSADHITTPLPSASKHRARSNGRRILFFRRRLPTLQVMIHHRSSATRSPSHPGST
jgi:hypothetical protein